MALRLLYDLETDGLEDAVTQVHCLVTVNLTTGGYRAYVKPEHLEAVRLAAKGELDLDDPDYYPIPCDPLQPLEHIGTLDEGLTFLGSADYLAGHNIISYDGPVLDKLYPGRFKWSQYKLMDTLVASKVLFSNIKDGDQQRIKDGIMPGSVAFRPHSLEAWGYRLGVAKGDYSAAMKDAGLDPWASFNIPQLVYCIRDVELNYRLWKVFRNTKPDPRSIELEMAVSQIILQQERNGFPFDEAKAAVLYGTLSARRQELLDQCAALFPPWFATTTVATTTKGRRVKRPDLGMVTREIRHKTSGKLLRVVEEPVTEDFVEGTAHTKIKLSTFNPSSRDHVSDRFIKLYGWEPQEYGSDGKPTVDDDILQALPYPPAKLLAEYYLVEKRVGMLAEGKQAWLKAVKSDGCIHGRVNTNGAVTGRATHSTPNVAQVPSIHNASGPVPYGRECRELFTTVSHVPALAERYGPDWVLLGADASGLELRCLAHFMAPYDKGRYAEAVVNGDVHTDNMKAAGLSSRAQAKTFIYAFLYGAGPEKIGETSGVTPAEIAKYGTNKTIINRLIKHGRTPNPTLVATIRKGEVLMDSFLNKTPALKKLREKVGERFKQTRTLIGLDGRTLHCRSGHSALNTLLQSAGALLCKRWLVEMHAAFEARGWKNGVDYMQSAWVHDEVQIQCRKEIADELGQIATESVAKAGEYFGFRLPLAGEYKIGSSWACTH